MKLFSVIIFACTVIYVSAQDTIAYKTIQFGPEKCYARALHVLKNKVYIGASDGTFVSLNLEDFHIEKFNSPEGFMEIRDIESIGNKLFLMESSDSSEVYEFDPKLKAFAKTKLPRKDVFLDGLVGQGSQMFAFGDMIDSILPVFSLTFSTMEWVQWKLYPDPIIKLPLYLFAASGTTVVKDPTRNSSLPSFYIISGGKQSYFCTYALNFTSNSYREIPMLKGETSGPYSIAINSKNTKNMVIVGGDYKRQEYSDSCALVSIDQGKTWQFPKTTFIACGPTGSDISFDGGLTWKPFISGKFHACVVSKKYIMMSSNNGKVVLVNRKELTRLQNK
jgi:hypothetical protein